jgi:hypothetical protein
MPALGIGFWLQAVAADVEPDGRVEGYFLGQQQVDQLVMEDGRVLRGGKVTSRDPPIADGFRHPGD